MSALTSETRTKKGLRWWPAAVIVVLGAAMVCWVRNQSDRSFQVRNIQTVEVVLGSCVLLGVWWLAASGVSWRKRLWGLAVFAGAAGLTLGLFRIRGVSGDLLPILERRWAGEAALQSPAPGDGMAVAAAGGGQAANFPQYLGPDRTAVLEGPALARDWEAHPPRLLWRKPVGAAWSGWAVVGMRALTQEQRQEGECSTCYETLTGRLLWCHAEPAHYQPTLGGEGPRATPTVCSNRVFTLGATGILNCLDLATGRRLWSHDITADARSRWPSWGFAGSPLVFDGLVVVSAGGADGRSLLAYHAESGELAWSGGGQRASYSTPFLTTLAGRRQILAFNARKITAHDAASGQVVWEYPWGIGEPQAAAPVVVGTNRVLFSSGYGVGSELLEIQFGADGQMTATRAWKSLKMKAKFANLVQQEGFLYGLDDGVLACLDLKDGAQKWRGNRYGHGQGLLVRNLFLLMAEDGELVLLQPTPAGPNELHRFRVFQGKTWNPIALAGDLLLVRTDQEAACLRLALEESPKADVFQRGVAGARRDGWRAAEQRSWVPRPNE